MLAVRRPLRPSNESRERGSRSQSRRVRALLRTVSDGECCVKKSLGQTEIAERHAVIMQAQQQYPALSIRHLCSVLEVNRAWYYASQQENTGGDPDVAVRVILRKPVLRRSVFDSLIIHDK